MSKYPDYINTAVGRINEFLPEPANVMEPDEIVLNNLPLGIVGAYDFYVIEILGRRFLLGGIGENEDDLPPNVLAKQRDVLQKKTGMIPIFIFDRMASYNFPRYTKKNLNIVVGNRQVFLPSLFLIAEKESPVKRVKEEKIPVAFQLMVLYHLQKEKLDGLTMRELAERLNISYATVNRAIRWMVAHEFVQLSGGKEKIIQFAYQGKELWENAVSYFVNPIEFIAYTSELAKIDKALISEQNALAEYTLLNGGPQRIAISKDVYKDIKGQVNWNQFGDYGVEVWKYDPRLLSENGTVDRLSLYLLLKDYEDERVQIELENMMNEIVW